MRGRTHSADRSGHWLAVMALVTALVVVLGVTTASRLSGSGEGSGVSYSTNSPEPATAAPSASSSSPATVPAETLTPTPLATTSALPPAATVNKPKPPAIQQVPAGSITRFAVMRNGKELFSAPGYALPIGAVESDRCEVPGQPCYDPPDGMVALVDGSAFPSVPSTNTSVAAGHSNRFHPNDPRRGVFTRLLDVRPGDILVVTTTKGVFTYLVVDAKEIPFDQTATSDVMTDRVANRFIAITCKISPDYSRYTGNFVVVSTLIASRPLN